MSIDLNLLHKRVDEGYINTQVHPTADLRIFNYSPKAQYEQIWDEATKAARGLILDGAGNIVARPFPKFFNLEEHSRSDIVFSKPFTVTDKMDGSLGILYHYDNQWAIATRGSFTSEQAVWATQLLNEKYPQFVSAANWGLAAGEVFTETWLFEIIYPQNRIVVNYKGLEDLVLLAVIDNYTGRDLIDPEKCDWDGPIVKSYDISCKPNEVIKTIGLTDDGNNEGVVLRFDWPKEGPNTRVKVKLEEYKRLHRILTGVSTKTVWEFLSSNRLLDELLERVPDEFNDWLKTVVNELRVAYHEITREATEDFEWCVQKTTGQTYNPSLSDYWDNVKARDFCKQHRSIFANFAKTTRYPGLVFMILDEQWSRRNTAIWKMLKPAYAKPFKVDVDS